MDAAGNIDFAALERLVNDFPLPEWDALMLPTNRNPSPEPDISEEEKSRLDQELQIIITSRNAEQLALCPLTAYRAQADVGWPKCDALVLELLKTVHDDSFLSRALPAFLSRSHVYPGVVSYLLERQGIDVSRNADEAFIIASINGEAKTMEKILMHQSADVPSDVLLTNILEHPAAERLMAMLVSKDVYGLDISRPLPCALEGLGMTSSGPIEPCRRSLRLLLGSIGEEGSESLLARYELYFCKDAKRNERLSALRKDAWSRRRHLVFSRMYVRGQLRCQQEGREDVEGDSKEMGGHGSGSGSASAESK
jgi:hypothetical protein